MNCSIQIPLIKSYIRQKKMKIKSIFTFFFTFLDAYLLNILLPPENSSMVNFTIDICWHIEVVKAKRGLTRSLII